MAKKSPLKKQKKASSAHKEKVSTSTKLVLPKPWSFTKEVFKHLTRNSTVFGRLWALAAAALLLVVGLVVYGAYADLAQATEEVSGQLSGGILKTVVEIMALYISVITGSLTSGISEAQQIYLGFTFVMLWLVMVWLLRYQMAGSKVTMRDGVYNAAAPLLPTLLVLLFGILQLLPFGLIVALLVALNAAGIVTGVLALLGAILGLGVFALTLYWLTGTLFALNVVTIPGTYPRAALRSGKQLVAGYRLPVLLRVLWLGFVLFCASLLLLPVIVLDAALGYALSAPVAIIIMLGMIVLFMYGSAYLYLLYRKVIDGRTD